MPCPPRSEALVKTLERGLAGGALTASACLTLANLLLAANQPQPALDAAKRGLKYVADRAAHGKERLKQVKGRGRGFPPSCCFLLGNRNFRPNARIQWAHIACAILHSRTYPGSSFGKYFCNSLAS